MGTRDEQREKRRQEILEMALDLFIRKGYAATKISDIAQNVGMSVGLLFHYFDSKEKLYEEPFVAKMFVLMGQAFYNEAAPQGVKDLLQGLDIYTPTSMLMKKGQANGTIREGDPYALGIAYWCAIQGIAEQLAMYPDSPCPESDWIVDMIRRKT